MCPRFAMLERMRCLAALAFVACAARVPEPQPARLVCNGAIVPAGYAYATSSSCYALPADPCWNNGSRYCRAEAERRREANRDADTRDRVGLALLGAVAVGLIVVLAVNP